MAFKVISNNRQPKKVAHIYQSFKDYGSTFYTTVDADKAEAKMESLKLLFPNHNWMIKYETI